MEERQRGVASCCHSSAIQRDYILLNRSHCENTGSITVKLELMLVNVRAPLWTTMSCWCAQPRLRRPLELMGCGQRTMHLSSPPSAYDSMHGATCSDPFIWQRAS